jgi:hypothetical protein
LVWRRSPSDADAAGRAHATTKPASEPMLAVATHTNENSAVETDEMAVIDAYTRSFIATEILIPSKRFSNGR